MVPTADDIQEATKEELEKFGQWVSDFKQSFETPSGKRVYEYLKKFCFENQSTFDKSSQYISSFNEGSRFVILEIKGWLELDLMKGIKL